MDAANDEPLTNAQIAAADLSDWRKLAQELHASFGAAEPAALLSFVAALGERTDVEQIAGIRVLPGQSRVDLQLGTRRAGRWVLPEDLVRAQQISALAAELGLQARPSEVAQLELALDVRDQREVEDFWAVLLTGSAEHLIQDSIFDPSDAVPSVWFQQTSGDPTTSGPPEQRWHFDLWLAPEVASGRIAAAVAAGGRIVDDAEAPSFTVLADAHGNRVCICTSLDR